MNVEHRQQKQQSRNTNTHTHYYTHTEDERAQECLISAFECTFKLLSMLTLALAFYNSLKK